MSSADLCWFSRSSIFMGLVPGQKTRLFHNTMKATNFGSSIQFFRRDVVNLQKMILSLLLCITHVGIKYIKVKTLSENSKSLYKY